MYAELNAKVFNKNIYQMKFVNQGSSFIITKWNVNIKACQSTLSNDKHLQYPNIIFYHILSTYTETIYNMD